MSRPVPPPSIPRFDITRFFVALDERARFTIADKLGRKALTNRGAAILATLIAIYRSQLVHAASTTRGAVLAAIDDVIRNGEKHNKSWVPFTSESSGLDADTFNALERYARTSPRITEQFNLIAEQQIEVLKAQPRVVPATEALKYFCAMLRHFFLEYAKPNYKLGPPARLRQFVLSVLTEAGVERTDFINQPGRLDEFCNTFIPLNDLPPEWVRAKKWKFA
jgi:hypothetical protein